jgi:osmotically inducible protein OsmC
MATFERHVDVDRQGSVMDGKGEAKAGSGAFSLPVTFPNRIGEANGKTSPEELMAAAHAACYAMALNGTLGRKQASADRTLVRATVTADKSDAGIKIVSSKLTVTAYGLKASTHRSSPTWPGKPRPGVRFRTPTGGRCRSRWTRRSDRAEGGRGGKGRKADQRIIE